MSLNSAKLRKMKNRKFTITKEEACALIDAIKRRPWLYDFKSYAFKRESVNARQRGWQAVVDDLHNRGMGDAFPDHVEVKMRWKNLKDTFRRLVKSLYGSKMAGQTPSRPGWSHFSEIIFMLPHCTEDLPGLDQDWFMELASEDIEPQVKRSPHSDDTVSESMITVEPVDGEEDAPPATETEEDSVLSELPHITASRSIKRTRLSTRKPQPDKQRRVNGPSKDYVAMVASFNALEHRFDSYVRRTAPIMQIAESKTQDEVDVFVKLLTMQMKAIEDEKILDQLQLDILGLVNKAKYQSMHNVKILRSQRGKGVAAQKTARTTTISSIPQYILLPPNTTLAPQLSAVSPSLKLPLDKPRTTTLTKPAISKPAAMTRLKSAILESSTSAISSPSITEPTQIGKGDINPQVMIEKLPVEEDIERNPATPAGGEGAERNPSTPQGEKEAEPNPSTTAGEEEAVREVVLETNENDECATGHEIAVQLMNEVIALSHPKCPKSMDIVDRGSDGVKFAANTSNTDNLVRWWIKTLREAYPEKRPHDEGKYGHNISIQISQGVQFKVNKHTGEVKLKGPDHWEWFEHNIDALFDCSPDVTQARDGGADVIDRNLGIQGIGVGSLIAEIPDCGCIKEGPLFTYTLWKCLLDYWFRMGCIVTIVTPQIDAERLADILLLMLKNRGHGFVARLYIQERCDGDTKFDKVKSVGLRILEAMKNPHTSKRMFSEEKIAWAAVELKVALQPFSTSCNFIGMTRGGEAEIYTTSARFHRTHFVSKTRDTVNFHRLQTVEYEQLYLEPLGMQYMADTLNGAGSTVSHWQSLSTIGPRSRSMRSLKSTKSH